MSKQSDLINLSSGDTSVFKTSDTERMRIDSSGNVGINSSAPTTLGSGAKLTVNQAADGNIVFARGGSTRQVQLGTTSTTGYINADNTSVGLAFHVNGTERMRIDNVGRVTMPYQPAFFAYSSLGATTSSSAFQIPSLNLAYINRGSHYNPTNGRFTAPVAGVYYFVFTVYWNAPNGYVRNAISLNGTRYGYSIHASANGDVTVIAEALIYCNVGDFVEASLQSDQSNNYYRAIDHTNFRGYLIG